MLWLGIGDELSGMLKLSEGLGQKAGTEDNGVRVWTMQDLGLKVGEREDDRSDW